MKYLLDTHAFVWWSISSHKLPPEIVSLLKNKRNTIFLSIASIWELQIKIQTGKMSFPAPLPEVITRQHKQNKFRFLPISTKHIYGLASLPLYHRDPFDRLLVAQAIATNLPLITDDSQIVQYPVQVVW